MGKEMETRTFNIKKGIIIGIVLLLFMTHIVPASIGQKQTTTERQTIPETPLHSIEKTASFTFYVIGKNSVEKQETMLSTAAAQTIYEHYQELQREMSLNPSSDTTQHLQQEFIRLLIEHDAIPTTLSQEQLYCLAHPPTPPLKHLPRSILPFQNKASEWFCNFATFGEGSAFPIIILPRFIPIILTPIPRVFIYWSTEKGLTSVGGLLSGTGFLAGGQQKGIALGFWGIGFSIFLPPIRSYGIFGYALYTRVTAEQFEFYPPNNPPRVTQTDPADGQQFVPLSTKELRFAIEDKDKDPISYSVTTEPDIGSDSGGLKPDGTYSVAVSGLESFTTYTWTIELTDGKDITKKTLTFTTEPIAPIISNPLPKNNAEFIPIWTSNLSFDLEDYQGDLMDWTVETQPDIGSGAANDVGDGRYSVVISGLDYFTSYKWFVNATDGTHWTKKTFVFTTAAEGELVFEPSDDTGVQHSSPNTNFGDNSGVVVRNEYGAGSGSGYAWDALIRFDISSIPTNASIQYAYLQLYYYAWKDTNPSGRVLRLFRATSTWNENTVTWNTQPTYATQATSFATVPSSTGTWMEWEVTGDIQAFVHGSLPNHGWKITDDTPWNNPNIPIMRFYTKEFGDFIPYLLIGYN
jgi:hypothetical protein